MLSAILITSALVFYTAGVWAERVQRRLLPWHAALFGAGLLCDLTGTLAMMAKVGQSADVSGAAAGMRMIMMVTGALALVLMAAHLTWAIVVLVRRRPRELASFHRLSLGVWLIWLVPFIAGGASAMIR